MTGEQINLVKTSFAKIETVAEEAGILFYVKLFKNNPELRELFKGKMNEQADKLMQMIQLVVKNLDRVEEVIPELQSLGARHTAYGVENSYYEMVGNALLWTLEAALGAEDFDDRTKEAWTAAYGLLSQTMKEGSRRQKNN